MPTPTPIPVHIADQPDFWLTYVVPWISTGAAVVAAFAAIWAIRAVHLSKKALNVARADFDLAQREFNINEAERNKKPAIYMTMNGSVDTRVEVESEGMIYLGAHIDNLGDRVAENLTVEIGLPLGMKDRHENAQVPDDEWLIAFAANNGTKAVLRQKPDFVLVPKAAPKYLGTMALGFIDQKTYDALPDTITIPWFITSKQGIWRGLCSVLLEPHQTKWYETEPPPIDIRPLR